MPSISSLLMKSDNLKTSLPYRVRNLINSNENCNVQQKLHSIINHLAVFENVTECEIYTGQSNDDQIVLIVNGQLGFVIIPLNPALIQISPRYMYYMNLIEHHELSSKFTKTQATVMDLYELIEKIKLNPRSRKRWLDEPLLISVCNRVSNEELSSTIINDSFLYFQLLIDGLLRKPYDQTSRREFGNLCRKKYKDNPCMLSKIEEFIESYVPEETFHGYSQFSFFFEMLNKALRVQDINILFLFRFFIQDLNTQLDKLQRKQGQLPFRAYRGQCMSKQELSVLKESIGQLIAMHSFLSTTLDRDVACAFASSSCEDSCHVLFEIDVNPQLSSGTKPYANISSESHFEAEKEILFMIASIFRLRNIREENGITIIQMELCDGNDDDNDDIRLLFEYMQMKNDKYHQCFSFGHILCTARMYDLAEQFYERMLKELEPDHPLIAELWGSKGLVKKAKGEIDISFQLLSKSLEKYEQMGDRTGVARGLQNLGNIHQMKGELNKSIDKYNQALNIFRELFGDQDKSVADCSLNLGAAYCKQRKFTEAFQYYSIALNIQRTILPDTHPDIAITINNIGNVYFLNDHHDCARGYFEQALDIFKISLPFEHPSLATIYYNMGLCYLSKKNYQRSLLFLNRTASIRRNTLSFNHPDVQRCVDTINFVKQQQSQEKQW